LIYINDLVYVLPPSIKVKLFGDDFKIYKVVNSEEDSIQLQIAIDKACDWASVNKMKFSAKNPSNTIQ
jgi:hypothetical protein